METKSIETLEGDINPSITCRIALIDIAVLTLFWIISLCIVNPLGNFPLNDDWSYGLAVKHFIESGDFRPTAWTGMTLLTNVLWGSLFCIPGGFTFTALRLSTLILSLAGILGTYLLLRDICQRRWLALLCALTLGCNPIYYALSNTFMTDVPYTALTVLATLFFARCLKNGMNLDLIIATTLVIAATLSRQLAIVIPLAFGLSLILTRSFTSRTILRAAIPLLLCLGTLLVFQHWLAKTGRLPAQYLLLGNESHLVKAEGLRHVLSKLTSLATRHAVLLIKNTFVGLLYIGLFLLPVLIVAAADIWRTHRKPVIAVLTPTIGILVLGSVLFALFSQSPAVVDAGSYPRAYLMPMSGNILLKSGIGPLTLPDSCPGGNYAPALPALPFTFWLVITAMSLLGAGLLITILGLRAIDLVPRLRLRKICGDEAVGVFLFLNAMIYLLPLFLIDFIDRYLIPPIPFFAAGIACLSGAIPQFRLYTRAVRFAAVALLAALSIFAVGSTSDYLAWNRARWEALHELLLGA